MWNQVTSCRIILEYSTPVVSVLVDIKNIIILTSILNVLIIQPQCNLLRNCLIPCFSRTYLCRGLIPDHLCQLHWFVTQPGFWPVQVKGREVFHDGKFWGLFRVFISRHSLEHSKYFDLQSKLVQLTLNFWYSLPLPTSRAALRKCLSKQLSMGSAQEVS